ncbi:MAG TPA: 30S ribosomal protein S1 [Defluviitaleaceae bacterium]|jgi:small subunit ribosomal protein S1|nr:30S ribosomal protein S1 [Candidatus Epulonipiscium sp.]HOQ16749.1 30S ribosomal protein S1 [Defluviitaleaceae bacterium]HPT75944.1 30S ribosomal protein S1 [Defluviitaleaceae bacterium]HQD50044.1 30S ribosomal protein S1 [Defluviitaleaceae bacterium]
MENNKEMTMAEMIEDIDKSMRKLNKGDIIKGKVIKVNENDVLVNIGYMLDGIIPKEELSDDANINPRDIVSVDDEIDVYVLEVDDDEGNVRLSKKLADQIVVWDELEEYFKSGSPLEVTVKEVVKGGVVANIKGVRAFIPASQLSVHYVEDLNRYLGKALKVKLIDFDRKSRRVVLSAKEIEQAEREIRKKEIWKSLKRGEKRKGVVTRLVKFGAFVDIGGVEGLIHLSDLSWKRVMDPSEVVSVGDEVEVYVLNFDEKKERISLSLKDKAEDPWNNIMDNFKVNDLVEGKVVRLAPFGAFVEIAPGIEGLLHISEISDKRISKVSEVLSEGDKVKVRIIELKPDNKKLSLSMKEAHEDYSEEIKKYNFTQDEDVTIGDLLKDQLKGLKF